MKFFHLGFLVVVLLLSNARSEEINAGKLAKCLQNVSFHSPFDSQNYEEPKAVSSGNFVISEMIYRSHFWNTGSDEHTVRLAVLATGGVYYYEVPRPAKFESAFVELLIPNAVPPGKRIRLTIDQGEGEDVWLRWPVESDESNPLAQQLTPKKATENESDLSLALSAIRFDLWRLVGRIPHLYLAEFQAKNPNDYKLNQSLDAYRKRLGSCYGTGLNDLKHRKSGRNSVISGLSLNQWVHRQIEVLDSLSKRD